MSAPEEGGSLFDGYGESALLDAKRLVRAGELASRADRDDDYEAFGAVSLTANPDPTPLMDKSIAGRGPLAGELAAQFAADNPGTPIPAGPGTDEVRLTIVIPDDDPNLFTLDFECCHVLGFTSQANVDRFVDLGGGTPGEWYVYVGPMPAAYIVDRTRLR